MRRLLGSILILAAIFMTGCASVPMASIDADNKAKGFAPQAGKANLYVYRNETFGAAVKLPLAINGRMLGETGPKTYFHLSLLPGRYEIDSRGENVSKLALDIEAGKNYFVWQEVKMGMWMARTQLQQVDDKTGRAGVLESKLAAAELREAELTPVVHPDAVRNTTAGTAGKAAR